MFRLTAQTLLKAARPAVIAPRFTPLNLQSYRFYSLPKQEINDRVVDVVKGFDKVQSDASITESTNFVQDLGLDSLDAVEVLVAIEEEFDIEIEDDDADKIKTVGQVIEYIENHPDAN